MNASGSGDNGKYCGKTLRKPDNADEKDGTDGKDDTDDTEQCGQYGQYGQYGRYELVRIGNPMDWQTVRRKRKKQRKRRKRRKDRAKNRPAKTQALRPGPKAGLNLNNYLFWSPRIRIATSRIVVSSSVTTPPSGPGSK